MIQDIELRWVDRAKLLVTSTIDDPLGPCNCIGPQNGEPRCPCAMRHVQIVNGRYVVPAQDLGPVVMTLRTKLTEQP